MPHVAKTDSQEMLKNTILSDASLHFCNLISASHTFRLHVANADRCNIAHPDFPWVNSGDQKMKIPAGIDRLKFELKLDNVYLVPRCSCSGKNVLPHPHTLPQSRPTLPQADIYLYTLRV